MKIWHIEMYSYLYYFNVYEKWSYLEGIWNVGIGKFEIRVRMLEYRFYEMNNVEFFWNLNFVLLFTKWAGSEVVWDVEIFEFVIVDNFSPSIVIHFYILLLCKLKFSSLAPILKRLQSMDYFGCYIFEFWKLISFVWKIVDSFFP